MPLRRRMESCQERMGWGRICNAHLYFCASISYRELLMTTAVSFVQKTTLRTEAARRELRSCFLS